MSRVFKAVRARNGVSVGDEFEHVWTERTPNGDSGLRSVDRDQDIVRVPSTILQDERYFELVITDNKEDPGEPADEDEDNLDPEFVAKAQEQLDQPTIVQFAAAISETLFFEVGLGNDGKVYVWDRDLVKWVLHRNNNTVAEDASGN